VRALRIDSLVRATIARRRVSILMYHQPTPETLERHLRYLARHYRLIPLRTLVEALHRRTWDNVPKRALVVTIDDGARAVVGLLDLLRRYEVPATTYVCSAIVGTNRRFWFEGVPDPWDLMELPQDERLTELARLGVDPCEQARQGSSLTLDELGLVAEVAEIGSHTRLHPPLPTCTAEEAELEIRASRAEIEAVTGRRCRDFCYPHGIYGEREVGLARASGYDSARTTDIGWNGPGTDPFRLRILGTIDDGSVARLAAELSGIGFLFRWRETGRLDGRLAA
jgi:peptidoglycan/xylan/chitin deacetylase (PgdA/CDA1 family)